MQSKATTVAQYIRELPADRQRAIKKLRAVVKKAAPRAKEGMQYGMPAYMVGDEPLCAFASQKHYLALYVCPADVLDEFRPRLGKLDCGKGCIRFRKPEDLPLDVADEMLRKVLKRFTAAAKIRI